MKPTVNIQFVDFWDNFIPQQSIFYQLLTLHYDVCISDNPDYIFFSVFGNRHLDYNQCIKIFYTGECQTPDFNFCDYAIGFDRIDFKDRYLRFPLYYTYADDYKYMLTKHIQPSLKEKTEFCAFVYSNRNAAPQRQQFLQLLTQYKHVNSGGRFQNNIGKPVDDKRTFQSKHKFVIAFENAQYEGYTTEKLLQAFAAHTIPIYWGDPTVVQDFNSDSFINCNDYNSFEDVVECVRKIDNDDQLYLNMLAQPAINNGEQQYKNAINQLDQFLAHIFDQPIQNAYRYPREYWNQKQRRLRILQRNAYQHTPRAIVADFYKKYILPYTRKNKYTWGLTQKLQKLLHMQ